MKRSLLAVLVLAAPALLRAQEGPLLPGGPGNFARYRFEDTFGRAGGPTITDHRLDFAAVVSSSPAGTWSLSQRLGHFGLSDRVQIPNGGPAVPRSLWSEETGARYRRQMEGGRSWGAGASVGSDSDDPFRSIHETTLLVLLDMKVPSGERNAWMFFLNYSNNRYFLNNIPIPGVGYEFQTESRKLRGVVGLPFAALFWTPDPLWEARLSVFGPRRISADVGRRFGPLKPHAGFDWSGQMWLRAGRSNNSDALNFERKRLYVGLMTPLPSRLMLDVSGGRQFDQLFYEGHGFSPPATRASLPSAWFLSSTLTWRFGPAPRFGDAPPGMGRGSK